MSEYAGGSQPATRHVEFEDIDHTGTLFEGHFTNIVSTPDNSVFDELPGVSIEQEPQVTARYPETVAHRQQVRRERLLGQHVTAIEVNDEHDDRDTPYGELGGGLDRPNAYQHAAGELSQVENIDIILRDYQSWMRDVRLAIDRYGLLDITPDDAQRMTQEDQKILALYVDGFMDGLATIMQLIVQFEGVADRHDFFKKYTTSEHGVPTPEMFKSYLQTLVSLSQAIKQQGAAKCLVGYAADRRKHRDQRSAARKRNKDAKRDTPYLYYDDKTSKYRVELVPLKSDTLPPY